MQFYYGGKTWDTDKPVYVVGRLHKGESWFPLRYDWASNGDWIGDWIGAVKCKQGTIRNIHIDYNFGQSFVCDFEICVPPYGVALSVSKVIVTETPHNAKKMLLQKIREGEGRKC